MTWRARYFGIVYCSGVSSVKCPILLIAVLEKLDVIVFLRSLSQYSMCSFNGFLTVRPFLNRHWFLARYYCRTSLASFHEKILYLNTFMQTHIPGNKCATSLKQFWFLDVLSTGQFLNHTTLFSLRVWLSIEVFQLGRLSSPTRSQPLLSLKTILRPSYCS